MTATHTAAAGFRRALRLAVGTAALCAFGVGVPWLLWQAAGGQPLPAPGPGGWAEVWAELKVGQLPETAVTAAVVVVGWAVWTYLAVIVLDEIRVAWRDRHQSADRLGRLNEISSFRRLVARGVGWLLAGQTMAAGFLVTPSAGVFDARPPVVAVDTDQASTGLIDVIGETQSAAAAPAFDPYGYLDLAADPQPRAVGGGAAAAEVVERVIEPGDNLWTIAEELTGDGFNYRAIWAATDLDAQDPSVDPTNPDLIFPGNVVRIPTSLITPGTEIAAPIDNAALASAQPGPAPDVAGPTDTPAPSSPAVPAPVSTAPGPVVDDAADGGDPAVSLPGRPTDNAADGAPVGKEQEVAPGPGPSEEPSSDLSAALIPALGLGGAGGAMLLAGVARRRRRAMAASGRGQRPPRQHRAAARTSQRLQADLPAELWAPDDLVAAWNSLNPVDPGARQPWCVRWNSVTRALECAWTPEPDGPAAGAPGEPPHPGPASAWRLVVKHDRSGEPVPVWTLTESDIPPAPNRLVLPAMVGCANGRRDRPSADGFFINLEAAGIVAVESSNPELIEPEGVARALLLQLQANGAAEVHLLDTDLRFDEVDYEIHLDPMALENHLVTELTANQDLWDEAESMFALRSGGYDGPTHVVVGPAEQLQQCSHLLSLARAGNVPLAVIALGPLSNAWATFLLEPEPDKHAIRFPSARAVLTFDHLSWVSTTDAADLVELIAASSRSWRNPSPPSSPPPPAVDQDDADFDGVDRGDLGTSAGGGRSGFLPDVILGSGSATDRLWAASPSADDDDWPESAAGGGDDTEAARVAELWDSLPEADPTSLADRPSAETDASEFDWAVAGDDDTIDDILGTSLDCLVNVDATKDRPPGDRDDEQGGVTDLMLADVALTGDGHRQGAASGLDARASALSTNGTRSAQATLRLLHRGDDAVDDDTGTDCDGQEADAEPGPELVSVGQAAGASGLRLELCGPIRLLRRSACATGFEELPMGGGSGLTGARLALLAYLAVAGRTGGGGVGREQIATEFWPEVHADGTLREVRSDTVKRRVWELRKVLADIAGVDDGRELLDGTDGRYGIGDIVCDWHELRAAVLLAESQVAGSDGWGEAVATIQGLVRSPGLLTPPGASRARSQFSWIDHYEARVTAMTRRVVTVLTDHARILTEAGRQREALHVLGSAREMSDSYPREVADGMVAAYLALGDPVQAERECEAYEALFDAEIRARERERPQPGSPRARLNDYRRRPTSGRM